MVYVRLLLDESSRMTSSSSLFYGSSGYYTRPYRIPVPAGSTQKIDSRNLWNEDVPEGYVSEYIAYRQGLPVTQPMVWMYVKEMGLVEHVDAKSLGNVAFVCSDTTYYTPYDLSTLARHFDLIDNIAEHTTPEKDGNENHLIPMSHTSEEMQKVLDGIMSRPTRLLLPEFPYRCLQFLRPRDTSYYMRYNWKMAEKGLITTSGELSTEETMSFLREVSLGLDEETRAYLSDYNRITGSTVIGPLVAHIVRTNHGIADKEDLRLLRFILADKPSTYLVVLCKMEVDYNLLLAELDTLQLNDGGEHLTARDWHKVQETCQWALSHTTNWQSYLRVVAIMGWHEYFPSLEGFVFPIVSQLYSAHNKLKPLSWMDDKMKNHVNRANQGVPMPAEWVE